MRRRSFLGLGFAAASAWSLSLRAEAQDAAVALLSADVADIEARSGGRLGVALIEVGGPRRWSARGTERFPLCSTFKILLAAAVLARVDRGQEALDRRVTVSAADLVGNSPFARSRAGGEASVRDLCEAAMTLSDDTAANLLLPSIGGPAGLTSFARQLGDALTRLDRIEPALNEAAPGDPRDTTTPEAMASSVEKLVFGEGLSPASRGNLTRWLIDGRSAAKGRGAGLPPDWTAGSKAGAGLNGTSNEVAVMWPPDASPLILACYLTGSTLDAAGRDAALAAAAAAVTRAFG